MISLPLRERWLRGSVARHSTPRGATGCVRTSRSLPAAPAPGFAAVVATPLAMLVALEWGSRALFLLVAAAYGVASLKFGIPGSGDS